MPEAGCVQLEEQSLAQGIVVREVIRAGEESKSIRRSIRINYRGAESDGMSSSHYMWWQIARRLCSYTINNNTGQFASFRMLDSLLYVYITRAVVLVQQF